MQIPFSKYSGCGNDFILVDNRTQQFPHKKEFIKHLCHRQKGVGADGIILLENSKDSDFRMRIFNADGSEAEMCGNGIRCLLKYIRELGFTENSYGIQTHLRNLNVKMADNDVSVEMGQPFDLRWNSKLTLEDSTFTYHHINTGVPHAILFVEDFELIDIEGTGSKIRHHSAFHPHGANVNFAMLDPDGFVRNRTYERGVEQETLACGTGCTAVAIAASKIHGLKSPVRIRTQSDDILEISFDIQDGTPCNVKLTGPATKTFEGSFYVVDI